MVGKLMKCPACVRVLNVPERVDEVQPVEFAQTGYGMLAPFEEESRLPVPLARVTPPAVIPDWHGEERQHKSQTLLLAGTIVGGVGIVVLLIVLVASRQPAQQQTATAPPTYAPEARLYSPPIPGQSRPTASRETGTRQPEQATGRTLPPYDRTSPKPTKSPVTPDGAPKEISPEDPANSEEEDAEVAQLAKRLRSRKATDKLKAAEALAQMGRKGKAASRALCEAMLDGNPNVRLVFHQSSIDG